MRDDEGKQGCSLLAIKMKARNVVRMREGSLLIIVTLGLSYF